MGEYISHSRYSTKPPRDRGAPKVAQIHSPHCLRARGRYNLVAMPNLGPTELFLILLIAVLLLGVGRLGRLGGELGKGIREFRRGLEDSDEEGAEESAEEAATESAAEE